MRRVTQAQSLRVIIDKCHICNRVYIGGKCEVYKYYSPVALSWQNWYVSLEKISKWGGIPKDNKRFWIGGHCCQRISNFLMLQNWWHSLKYQDSQHFYLLDKSRSLWLNYQLQLVNFVVYDLLKLLADKQQFKT